MNLDNDFRLKYVNRYVRDGMIALSNEPIPRLCLLEDWPTIEEIKVYIYKQDRRVALLTRDLFDYSSYLEDKSTDSLKECWKATLEERMNPTKWEHVTYGANVKDLEVLFKQEERAYLLFSCTHNINLFSANLNFSYSGRILITATMPKDSPAVSYFIHLAIGFEKLAAYHLSRLSGQKCLQKNLAWNAAHAFNYIMYFSKKVGPLDKSCFK